ncbi:MAG: DNA translocase FtsK [Chloroflexi bacterium]|nr:MAG: DNA translocase FtsK [Chloroflexota bacterium]
MRYGDDRADEYDEEEDAEDRDELEYVDDDELDDLYRRTSTTRGGNRPPPGGRTGFSGGQGSSSRLPGGGSRSAGSGSRLPGNVGRSTSSGGGGDSFRRGVSNFARNEDDRSRSSSPPPRRPGTGSLPSDRSRPGTGSPSSDRSRPGAGSLSQSRSVSSGNDDKGGSGRRFGNPLKRGGKDKDGDKGKRDDGGRFKNPLNRGDKGAKKDSGGRFGNPLKRGGKDDSPSSRGGSSSSGGGRKLGILGRGGDKKPSSSERSGGIGGRLGGLRRGGKDDKQPGTSAAGSRSVAGSGAAGRRPALGSRASSQAADAGGGGLRSRLPFGGGREDRPERPSTTRRKTPRVQNEGLSLDTKLDILGVVLVFASLALFLSILSPNRGSLTGSLNLFISQAFGWGKLAFPLAMFAVGIWLIKRHFGDEAPTLEITRAIGFVVGFLGVLTLFQFIDSFNYTTLSDLRTLRFELDLAWMDRMAGGGWIGAQIYYFMVVNLGEIESFVILLGWLVISLMLILSLSAGELAVVTISIWRSFHDAIARRSERRRVARQAAAAEIPALRVSKPAEIADAPATELPAGHVAGALPAATQPAFSEERQIPITAGGRTFTAKIEGGESVAVGQAAEKQSAGRGRFGRVLGGIPLGRRADEGAAKPVAASRAPITTSDSDAVDETNGKKSRLRGRLRPGFLKRGSSNGDTESVETQDTLPVTAQATPSPMMPTDRTTGNNGEERPTRVGDLLRPKAPSPAPPAQQSDASTTDESAHDKAEGATGRGAMWRKRFSSFGGKSTAESDDDTRDSETQEAQREAQEVVIEPPPSASTPPITATQPDLARHGAADSVEEELSRPRPAASRTAQAEAVQTDDTETPAVPRPGTLPRPSMQRPDVAERAKHLDALRGRPMPSRPGKPVSRAEETDDKATRTSPVVPAAAPEESTFRGRPTPVVNRVDEAAKPETSEATAPPEAPQRPASAQPQQPLQRPAAAQSQQAAAGNVKPTTPPAQQPSVRTPKKDWKVPQLEELLMSGSDQDIDREFLLERARIIEDTLQSFGAPGRVVEVNTGPVITQFGVEPDYLVARSGKKTRVKVGAIAQLDKDLQLALGAKSIRVEAPVPGKGYVGIEVPNAEPALVSLRDVMESNEFQRIDSPLAIALGQSVDGTPVAADLTAMPHLLIAGTTGSGKSVLVNAIISSLLIRNRPDHVKLIMVDPKRVELTGYNGIPHLVAPVVVELERIVGVLKWVTHEMDNRYKKFSNAQARNIVDFNNHLPSGEEHMPYIVVIIDELADLMMLAPDETERVITRIAALARATGIHLVIATQRPSVDVVTGLIKANFPARIAFAVAGGVDSRVILDQPGAERLLGRGDMLYLSGNSPAPVRLQGVFVSDIEINNIVRYWRTQVGDAVLPSQIKLDLDTPTQTSPPMPSYDPQSMTQSGFWGDDSSKAGSDLGIGADNGVDDELYDTAVELVRRLDKASVSLLQRRLRIGYTRAARLIDAMEEYGVIGPAESGSKPREVLPVED